MRSIMIFARDALAVREDFRRQRARRPRSGKDRPLRELDDEETLYRSDSRRGSRPYSHLGS